MFRAGGVLHRSWHAVGKHLNCTWPCPLHLYNTKVSKFCWSYSQVASAFSTKCEKAKLSSLHHIVEQSAAAFAFPCCKICQHSNTFSKQSSVGSINSSWMKNGIYSQHALVSWGAYLCTRSYTNSSTRNDGLQSAASTNYTKDTIEKTTDGKEWSDILNNTNQSVADALSYMRNKAKDLSDGVTPYIQQIYDSSPYMENVIIPAAGITSATLLAWFVMPRILRKFYKFTSQSPLTLLSASSAEGHIPYDKSMWSALEDPARYLLTFMAFSELGVMIVPATSQYIPQAWRGAVVISLVWFFHRWKSNVFARMMENQTVVSLDRDKLLTLDKLSTMALLILGATALAEAFGVAVKSVLTVSGIGGVATAFAAKDILGNIFSGLTLQFARPFSLGDVIKAGSIEGQVVEVGLTTTSLVNSEKFPVIVPNSLFSSQVIVNKSRAQLHACLRKIPIHIDDLEKVPHVTEEIELMLRSHPRVSLEKDAPYCFLSNIESQFLELSLGCNLKNMKKVEKLAAEQEILLKTASIIKKHGAKIVVAT
ncbi:Mechanosensitive ion channel protein 1, mitochondrial [Apostasia shenzhenica]|uniref:Mechanosensitive ion channel protein 1, mitochondrial n=1 Tax=Apostasia shenzhenica TaxID=1088818 RepID=A0A2I0AY11_9ASPA|nr:Mechanosensitive ion channel protein 1, mitochondrial [Apostasia shenzhenica]